MINIVVNQVTHKFEFYKCKVSWKENGVSLEEYTNTPSLLEQTIRNQSRQSTIESFEITTHVPTDEQKTRLKEINDITTDQYIDGFIQHVNDFVNTGYIDNTYPEFMVTALLKKYEDVSKKILLKDYSSKLAAIRYDKEVSGVEFMGKKVKTDRESQSTITSTVVLFNSGSMNSVDFKCDNNEWLLALTKESFMLLAAAVSGHVNACFKAEALTNNILAEYPLDKLVDGIKENQDIEEKEDKLNLEELYNETYLEVMSKLRAGYNKEGDQEQETPETSN